MDIHQQILSRLNHLEHSRDAFARIISDQTAWIAYFDAERETIMATVEELKAKLPALDEAVRQVGDYVHTLSQKVDAASEPHPAVQEMIDHVTGLTDALSRMVPQTSAEEAPEAAPEPALSPMDASETETQTDEAIR